MPSDKSTSGPGQKPASNDADPKADDITRVDTKVADLLSTAAASTDPAVQQVLAEREIASLNGDREALKDLDGRLRGLIEK